MKLKGQQNKLEEMKELTEGATVTEKRLGLQNN